MEMIRCFLGYLPRGCHLLREFGWPQSRRAWINLVHPKTCHWKCSGEGERSRKIKFYKMSEGFLSGVLVLLHGLQFFCASNKWNENGSIRCQRFIKRTSGKPWALFSRPLSQEGRDSRRAAQSELTISQGRGEKKWPKEAVLSDTHWLFIFQEWNIANWEAKSKCRDLISLPFEEYNWNNQCLL